MDGDQVGGLEVEEHEVGALAHLHRADERARPRASAPSMVAARSTSVALATSARPLVSRASRAACRMTCHMSRSFELEGPSVPSPTRMPLSPAAAPTAPLASFRFDPVGNGGRALRPAGRGHRR